MRTTRTIVRSLLLVVLAVAVAGCASAGRGTAGQEVAAFVSVSNHNFLDVNVYVQRPGATRRRLGIVTGTRTETFVIPREFVSYGTVRIVAVPIGGFGAASSGQVSVNRGDTIVFNVEQNLALSSVIIR
jgi:hypothetical protein